VSEPAFLSRLTARALGREAALVPRPRHRFATAPVEATPDAPAEPLQVDGPDPMQPGQEASPEPIEMSTPGPDAGRRPAHAGTRHAMTDGLAPDAVTPRVDIATEPMDVAGDPQARLHPHAQMQPQARAAAPIVAPARGTDAPTPLRAAARMMPPVAAPPRVAPPERPPYEPRSARGREREPAPDAGIDATTTVTVHIGRIDVRAVPAPPAPVTAAPAKRPPSPSLDAYLNGRDRWRP
jgi:hypothetical protein